MVAGEYDFIVEQTELFGEQYINSLIEAGYTPYYVSGTGWRWLLTSVKSNSRV